MENPFHIQNYDDQTDWFLVGESLNGSKASLEKLISRHQTFIYNVAWKMVLNPQDAEDYYTRHSHKNYHKTLTIQQ
jgi:hypothetical protein